MSRTGHRGYRRNRARALRNSDVCHLCGGWIDPDLKYPDPMSASADHVQPVSRGGSNTGELRAAHLRCNIRRGNRNGLPGSETPVRHGRAW
ncbi:HNH endonuclease [Rhodococcus sp. 1168]|uniref:HNH endonuclease n=1 Tax=Rhodococcus sp. 1168 TaxID=2018041 RepID=UPI000B5AC0C0